MLWCSVIRHHHERGINRMTSTQSEVGFTDLTRDAVKETLSVSRTAHGTTSITCSLTWENFSVKWTVKTFESQIAKDTPYCRKRAMQALDSLILVARMAVSDE